MRYPKCNADNSDDTVFCGLCYEPFPKKEAAVSANEPAPVNPNPEPVRVHPTPVRYNSQASEEVWDL